VRQYIAKRLLLIIPSWIGVSMVIFVLLRIVPGDAASALILSESRLNDRATEEAIAAVREKLGLNDPLYVQYAHWVGDVLHLNLGKSLWSRKPVTQEIAEHFPVTAQMAVMAVAISLLIAIPIGVLSAVRQDTFVDYLFRVVSIAGLAMPNFFVGTLIVLFLIIVFQWAPPLGYTPPWKDLGANLQQLIWPAAALGYSLSAIVSRMTRSQMLEVLREDYVRTAWAKGLRERQVVLRHALKNAFLPVITITGTQLAVLLGGTVIMEQIFSIPGMGRNLIDAINHRDYPLVQGVVFLMATIFLVTNLLIDILYAWLDPRIRYR